MKRKSGVTIMDACVHLQVGFYFIHSRLMTFVIVLIEIGTALFIYAYAYIQVRSSSCECLSERIHYI